MGAREQRLESEHVGCVEEWAASPVVVVVGDRGVGQMAYSASGY